MGNEPQRMTGPGRKPTVSDAEILNVFRESSDPILTTREVSDSIDIGQRGTFDRLERLVEDDTIKMKKVGGTGAVWWFPEELQNRYSSE